MSDVRAGWSGYAGVAAAVAVVVTLVVLGWAERDRFVAAEAGADAPAFTAVDLAGDSVRLADYEGQVVMLNFWATWCPPCLEEMPSMQRLYDELRDDGFVVLAVSLDAPPPGQDVRELVGEYVDRLELTFPILLDPEGVVEEAYNVSGLPTTYVIDRDGRIDGKVIGGRHWDAAEYRDRIVRLLEG